jgi:hypothetical protein
MLPPAARSSWPTRRPFIHQALAQGPRSVGNTGPTSTSSPSQFLRKVGRVPVNRVEPAFIRSPASFPRPRFIVVALAAHSLSLSLSLSLSALLLLATPRGPIKISVKWPDCQIRCHGRLILFLGLVALLFPLPGTRMKLVGALWARSLPACRSLARTSRTTRPIR